MAGSAGSPRNYTVSELKSRILNIAQTSIYHVKFGVPSNVMGFLSNRFINYRNISDIELMCSETSLPGTSLVTHEALNDYHGVSEKMAYRRMYDDTLDLTFYVDRDYRVIEFFDSWIDYICGQGTTFTRDEYKGNYVHYRMNYPNTYKSNIYLVKFEKDIGISMKYTFINAFPINIISTPVSYEESQLLKCTVSFSYIRYVRERSSDTIVGSLPDPRSPKIAEFNSFDFWKKNSDNSFDTTKLQKIITNEYYNNGIIRNSVYDQRQGPGDRRQDATNFSRGIG